MTTLYSEWYTDCKTKTRTEIITFIHDKLVKSIQILSKKVFENKIASKEQKKYFKNPRPKQKIISPSIVVVY